MGLARPDDGKRNERFVAMFDGMGRNELEHFAAEVLDNLTSVQGRCTELLLENRELRAGVILPGWCCTHVRDDGKVCGVLNGSLKQSLTHCRACGKPRPT